MAGKHNIRCSHKEAPNLGYTNALSKTQKIIKKQKYSNRQRLFWSARANFPAVPSCSLNVYWIGNWYEL